MSLPKYILRDCTIFVEGDSKIGQASEITLPVPTEKLAEIRNAGMVMPIEASLGFEKLGASFKMTAFDPQVMSLFGLTIGGITNFLVTGALAHEDGTVVQAISYIEGRISKYDPGAWKTGDLASLSVDISVRYFSLEVGGVVIASMSPFNVTTPGGVIWGAIQDALLS